MDAHVTLEAEVLGLISGDTHYCAIGTHECRRAWGENYTREPSFLQKKIIKKKNSLKFVELCDDLIPL